MDDLFITLVSSTEALFSSQAMAKHPMERLCQCPTCFRSGKYDHFLTYDELAIAFQRGQDSVSSSHPISILDIAPDIACAHVSKISPTFEEKIELGSGAYGKVWRATLKGRPVAVKEIVNATNDTFREFLHEVTVMRYLGLVANSYFLIVTSSVCHVFQICADAL